MARDGYLDLHLEPCSGEIFAPADGRYSGFLEMTGGKDIPRQAIPRELPGNSSTAAEGRNIPPAGSPAAEAEGGPRVKVIPAAEIPDNPYEQMSVEELQAVILAKMEKNGSVTERMRRDVEENIWHDSLVNWAKSF